MDDRKATLGNQLANFLGIMYLQQTTSFNFYAE